MMKIIVALNSLNQPWVAIVVIVLGMIFDIVSQHFNVSTDAATGVIGAGVGLLTSQGIHAANQLVAMNQPPSNPTKPADPAQPK